MMKIGSTNPDSKASGCMVTWKWVSADANGYLLESFAMFDKWGKYLF